MFESIALFISCKKEVKNIDQTPVTDSSHISITNVSPAISNLQFYLGNNLISLPGSPISYGKTVSVSFIKNATTYHPDTIMLPYINISSGYQQLNFSSFGNSHIVSVQNNNFEPGASYSIFLTDTVVHGSVASVLLKDNIGATDSTKSRIRFLNLSPDAPPIDVWAYPDGGVNGYKIFSNCAYLPNDFNSFINAESFTLIDRGSYVFIATEAGTSNIILSGQMVIAGQNIITIYTKGYVSGTGVYAIDVGVIQYLQ